MPGLYYYEGGDTCESHGGLERPVAEARFTALCARVDKAVEAGRSAGVKLLGSDNKVLKHYRDGITEGVRP